MSSSGCRIIEVFPCGTGLRLVLIAVSLLPARALCGATEPKASTAETAQVNPLSLSPKAWALQAAQNELKVVLYEHSYLRYHMHSINSKGDQVRDVLESKDGTVARMIYKDGRPLTAAEDAAEHDRLNAMLESPSAFAKHVHNDVTGKKMAADMIKLLPDAMIFAYAPGQPQRVRGGGHPEDPAEIVIDFKPNPAWAPTTMTSEALTGLQGRVWIDPATRCLTRMDGTIFQGVNFGFGFFAHIFPGGQLSLEQVKVGQDRWIFSHFVEHVTVRALMLKTFKENADLQSFDYTPVGQMGYQEAIRLLLDTPLPTK